MSRPFLLGLTGSIGMGKSTTAAMFAEEGIPVWDADAAVHRLYSSGGAGTSAIAKLNPEAISEGAVDRGKLKAWIAGDAGRLREVEAVVHPLVAADRAEFVARAQAAGEGLVVLDIPLLFETGADRGMDATLVVTAPAEVQRSRVLSRPGMTESQLEVILARQMPDAEKQSRATYVIETVTLDAARQAVRQIVARIRSDHA
ncbi:MAG: dephospho-CoA kinase [Paracoccaceae bacterium]